MITVLSGGVGAARFPALPRGLRDASSTHPLVKSLSTPPLKEGGEGVTIVEVAK